MVELQIVSLSIDEMPPSQPGPEPIAEPNDEPVASAFEFKIRTTPIDEMDPALMARPVPIPEAYPFVEVPQSVPDVHQNPSYDERAATTVELQIAR
jgi:hypothetical protein